MRSSLPQRSAVFALLVPALLAAAPASRHVKYEFSVRAASETSAAAGTRFTGPNTGVVDVTLTPASDGKSTFAEATEQWWNELRPEQAVPCELYANGNLACDRYPGPSMIELVLLPLLTTGFFDGIDGTAWQRIYNIALPKNYYSLSCSLALTVRDSPGPIARIAVMGEAREINGPRNKLTQSGIISFDRSASLPASVHEEWSQTALESVGEPISIDLQLPKDEDQP